MMKCGWLILKLRLLHIYNMYWKWHKITEEWLTSRVIPIFKKGDWTLCGNYKGIGLLAPSYKVFVVLAVLSKFFYINT